jgi:hypothetical protein
VTLLALGTVVAVAAAFLALRSLDRGAAVTRLAGEAMILAPALPAATLFLFSGFSIPWSRGALFGAGLVVIGLLLRARSKIGGNARQVRGDSPSGLTLAIAALAAFTILALLSGYARFAYVSSGAENDFIGIWGAKGRTFFEAGAIDWEFLAAPWRGYAHPDYPLLVPLMFSSVAVAFGRWFEPVLGLIYPLMTAGGLILAHAEFRRRGSSIALAAIGTLAVAPFLMSPWIGLADGPLALLTLAALLRMADWLEEGLRPHLTVASVFLGFAMSAKNEGLAIGVVAAAAVFVLTPRDRRKAAMVSLWPAAAIAGPWLVMRLSRGLSTDLFEGGVLTRLTERLLNPEYPGALVRLLVEFRPGNSMIYLLFLLVLVVWWRRLGPGGRFVAVVVLVQLMVDLGAYLVTPLPLEWHVRWSWERLVSQVGAVAAVVAVSLLVELSSGGRGLAGLVGTGPEVEHEEPDADADR